MPFSALRQAGCEHYSLAAVPGRNDLRAGKHRRAANNVGKGNTSGVDKPVIAQNGDLDPAAWLLTEHGRELVGRYSAHPGLRAHALLVNILPSGKGHKSARIMGITGLISKTNECF